MRWKVCTHWWSGCNWLARGRASMCISFSQELSPSIPPCGWAAGVHTHTPPPRVRYIHTHTHTHLWWKECVYTRAYTHRRRPKSALSLFLCLGDVAKGRTAPDRRKRGAGLSADAARGRTVRVATGRSRDKEQSGTKKWRERHKSALLFSVCDVFSTLSSSSL